MPPRCVLTFYLTYTPYPLPTYPHTLLPRSPLFARIPGVTLGFLRAQEQKFAFSKHHTKIAPSEPSLKTKARDSLPMNSSQPKSPAPAGTPDHDLWNYLWRVLWSSGITLSAFLSPFHSQWLFLRNLMYFLLGALTGPGIALITPLLSETGILPLLQDTQARASFGERLKTALIPALISGAIILIPQLCLAELILTDEPGSIKYQERQTFLSGLLIITAAPGLIPGILALTLRSRLPWLSLKKLLIATAGILAGNFFQLVFFMMLLFWVFNAFMVLAELSYEIINDELILKTWYLPRAVNIIPHQLWTGVFLLWFLGAEATACQHIGKKLARDAETNLLQKTATSAPNAHLMK